MKMVLEARDVKAVKDALSGQGIIATNEFVRNLILSSKALGGMLFECDSFIDTECREYIYRLLIKKLMNGSPYDEWPTYGHDESYTKGFYAAFKKAGIHVGLQFEACWDKDQ